MLTIYWISLLVLFYIYIGYPLLLRLLPKKPLFEHLSDNEFFPNVTVIIPAFNEEKVISATIENKLAQSYPTDKLSIIVVSDASEDNTDKLVLEIAAQNPRVELIRQTPRQGKTSGLNLAVEQIDSDIIVFSDANSHYDEDAIQHLVDCFRDDSVGYVTGKMVYVGEDGNLVGDGCSAYMKYENHLRSLESGVSSVVGVDGGIDACRRQNHRKLNADQLPDFVLPLKVAEQKMRVIYCEKAVLREPALNNADSEYRMRVRVSLRAYWALWDMRVLFNPTQYGFFSLQLFSHKLLRYLAFVPLTLLILSNIFLLGSHWIYVLSFVGQCCFYLSAYHTRNNPKPKNKWLGLASYFCLINIASAKAFLKFSKGEKIVVWKPREG